MFNSQPNDTTMDWTILKSFVFKRLVMQTCKNQGLFGKGLKGLFDSKSVLDLCIFFFHTKGDKTVQCGRKVDCFKLWFLWKALGDRGFEEITDRAFDNARYKIC